MCSRWDVKLCQNFHRAGVPRIRWKRNQNWFRKRSTECKSHCTENVWCAEWPECPVKAYKVYAEKRPAEMKTDDAPFYFGNKIMLNLETTTCCQLISCIQLSGRKNVQSITSYSTVSQKQQLNMSHTLTGKFDSPFFSEQWNQMAARINTKFRGKRKTLIHRLQKTSLFLKHKYGTISLSFPSKKLWVC